MFFRLSVWLMPAVVLLARLGAEELNGWPLAVRQTAADGAVVSDEMLGPLFFDHHLPGEPHQSGLRPLLLQTRSGATESDYLLYPFFTWHREPGYRSFSFFQLANSARETEAGKPTTRAFDVWPFYFSRDTGDPATSYQALFPLGGTIRQRLGFERIHFVLFPLYAAVDEKGAHITHAPWPFLRFIDGGEHHGFEFWPLFGHRGRPQDYDSQFYLWPLIYKSSTHLDEAEPTVKLGVLPFYCRATSPGNIDETYLWPFFGYAHQTEPAKYDEQRYFWPLLVQGRGATRYVNRWAPLYTHSVVKGYDKTWVAWPLFRHAEWQDGRIGQEQNQLLWFLYWSLTQRSLTNPQAAPAHKTHWWPLMSSWDNGAGQRQMQLLSPFEVFFPTNEPIRQLYTPLVALYRYEQQAPDDTRHSFLFSLVSWRKSPAESEFHLGPLFSTRSTPDQARVALGNGLLAWTRRSGTVRWKFSLFDFHPKPAMQAAKASLP